MTEWMAVLGGVWLVSAWVILSVGIRHGIVDEFWVNTAFIVGPFFFLLAGAIYVRDQIRSRKTGRCRESKL